MKLKTCLEIGLDCGLETVGEAIYNIELHATSLFDYTNNNQELNHLKNEAKELYSRTYFTDESSIQDVFEWLKAEEGKGE